MQKRGIQLRANLLAYLVQHQKQYNCAPSVAEMAQAMGVSSGAILHHLRMMEKMGIITRQKNEYRSVRVINPSPNPNKISLPFNPLLEVADTASVRGLPQLPPLRPLPYRHPFRKPRRTG
jgi:SOS-response transcriptional repressor LexA